MAVQFEAVRRPKFMSFLTPCRRTPVFVNAFAGYVYHVSFRRYRTLKCRLVAKSSKIGPQFLGPKFLRG